MSTGPRAKCSLGTLQGVEKDGVECFYTVPFAKPPLPPLRFKAPQPHDGWEGVRDAMRWYGQESLQFYVGKAISTLAPGIMGGPDKSGYGEDCLYW